MTRNVKGLMSSCGFYVIFIASASSLEDSYKVCHAKLLKNVKYYKRG
jgi:hypothetical protein